MSRNLTQAGGSYIGTMEQFEFDTPDRRASTELYVFSQDDVLLTILSPETGLREAPYREELNQVADTPFSFTVDADTEQSQHVREENQVVFRDKEGDLQLYVIKELDQIDNTDGPEITAICEPAFMELKDHIVVDRRIVDDTADVALDAALEGTRWTGSLEVSLGTATQNFYYVTAIDAIWAILDVWGGEFKAVVEYDDTNKVNRRVIKILQRRGSDKGHRWEIDHNIEEIQRTVLSYPVTAMYGRGASLQTEDGGHTRYIDFADAEWKKANGDPVDKPKGQKWVGDPDALQKYGRVHNGELLHREAIFSNQDYDDPAELLQATWEALQQAKEPEINYKLSVHLLEFLAGYEHEHVELGDTNQTVDRNFSRPIEIKARVIALEYDLLDIEGTAQAELGQFLSLDDERLDRVIEDIEDNRGKWEHPDIDEGNFPDVTPAVPKNVKAVGGFKTIQLSWDYDESLHVKHYEVFGSQLPDFVPDSSNMLWRGRVSGFAHQVETDQVWYYYVRAVNYHGTASDYSAKAEGQTVRIITDDILFGAVTSDKIKGLAVTAGKLAKNSISNEKLRDKIIDNTKLDDLAVEAEKLADSAVTSKKIANLAVGTAAIDTAAITAAKIGNAAVGNAAIANASISRAKLETAVIGEAQIEDGVITKAKIGNAAVDTANIANAAITNAKIKSLRADKIDSGTVNANRVTIEVKDGTQAVRINNKGLESVDSNGNVRIHLGVRNIAGKGQSDPSTIRFFGGSGDVSAGVGMNVNDTFVIGSEASGVHVEYRSDERAIHYARRSHRFVVRNMDNYWVFARSRYSGDSWNQTLRPNNSGWGYLGTGGYRLWRVYTNHLHYYEQHKLSTREQKQNIKDLSGEFSQAVFDKIDLKRFHYINSDNNSSARLESYGPVAEESPKEILDVGGKTLRQDNYVNVIAGSLKYQTSRIDDLEERIKQLEAR